MKFLLIVLLTEMLTFFLCADVFSEDFSRDKIIRRFNTEKAITKYDEIILDPSSAGAKKASENNMTLPVSKETEPYFISVRLESMISDKISIVPSCDTVLSFTDLTLGLITFNLKNEKIDFEAKNNMLSFKINGNSYISKEVVFTGSTRVISGKNQNDYAGKLKLGLSKTKILPLNVVDIEDYVKGVLEGEFPSTASRESIAAQAIAIRTYSYKKSLTNNLDLCDTIHCQVYKGTSSKPSINEAVSMTKGMILAYNSEPISAMYSADAGGATEDWSEVNGKNDFPYLKTVRDSVEIKHLEWTYSVKADSLLKCAGIKRPVSDILISSVSGAGRVLKIDFVDEETGKIIQISGDKIRNILGVNNIKSTLFTMSRDGDKVLFTGKGYGHGFGLCQKSCIEMGKMNYSYKQILNYFYPNTALSDIYSSNMMLARK